MHNYGAFAENMQHLRKMCSIGEKMSSLRFCHERGQNKRWGAVRHVNRSGIPIRVFFIFTFSHKKSVSRRLDVSCVVDVF